MEFKIYQTTDYSKFSKLVGNRSINHLHLRRLKKSIQENYLFTVIIVNEFFQIIDGQHRFEVIKSLGLPVYYAIKPGYGLNEVHILNANNKTYSLDAYLEGYCDLGIPDYIRYREFKEKYKFAHTECLSLLSNSSNVSSHDFKTGNYKIRNYEKAVMYADKILMVQPYHDRYRKRSFVNALHSLLKNENFNFSEFLNKLKQQPSSLTPCVTTEQYVLLIENIYNYKRREKVNLRY